MGFGILFWGYFLVLNFAYPGYTDAICAVIMLYGLYKLSVVNRGFRLAAVSSIAFALLGIFELALEVADIFLIITPILHSITAIARHFLIAVTTILTLIGMRDVSSEVGLSSLSKKCNYLTYATLFVYIFNIFLEASALGTLLDGKAIAAMALASITATLVLAVINLTSIYSCYMRICMPGEEEYIEKKSRFAFVEAFRRHEEEKQREYAEYRLQKLKKKNKKGTKK